MLDFGPNRELPDVLLIDDDLVSREVTATLLTMSGYSVHTAESGAASLKMIETRVVHPGIILMDAQMPGMSGIELVRELRIVAQPATIYIVSASKPSEELLAVTDGFLLKPFSIAALRALLDHGRPGYPGTARPRLDPDDPVLNPDVLGQLRQLMPREGVKEIYQEMVADLDRRIKALEAAVDRRDAAEIRRIGHAIKGGCGMAGAVQAARLGALLENVLPENVSSTPPEYDSFDDSRALLEELRVAAVALQHTLEEELEA